MIRIKFGFDISGTPALVTKVSNSKSKHNFCTSIAILVKDETFIYQNNYPSTDPNVDAAILE